jgi:hypothetical protein
MSEHTFLGVCFRHTCSRHGLKYLNPGFVDNFEGADGYATRFGVTYVDYETQARYSKESANLFLVKVYSLFILFVVFSTLLLLQWFHKPPTVAHRVNFVGERLSGIGGVGGTHLITGLKA